MKIVLPEKVTYIIDTLTQHGFEAYAVGGCVRDTMLGTDSHGLGHHDISKTGTGKRVIPTYHRYRNPAWNGYRDA